MARPATDNDDRRAMGKAFLLILVVAFIAFRLGWLRARQPAPIITAAPEVDPTDRVAVARIEKAAVIDAKYRAAAVQYPGEIFVRWLKREAVVELWARNAGRRFRKVSTYPILSSSDVPGPKRREGDRQVPEGCYVIDRFNPQSSFHLSLGLNYPNEADRVHADPQQPGSDIFIHGKDVSIGCAPIGDDGIEELYLAALDATAAGQTTIAVHIFPARMSGPDWRRFEEKETTQRPELAAFWEQLRPIYEAFEQRRLVPEVTVTPEGNYVLQTR